MNLGAVLQEIGQNLHQFYNSAPDPKVEMERRKEEFLSQEEGLKSGLEYLQYSLEEEVVESEIVDRLESEPEVGCAAREVLVAAVNMDPEHAKETLRTAIQTLAERKDCVALVQRAMKGLSESKKGASDVRKMLAYCQTNGESGLDACSQAFQAAEIPFELSISCQASLTDTYTGTDLQTCVQGLTVLVGGSDAKESRKLVQVVHHSVEKKAVPVVIRASVLLKESEYPDAPRFCRTMLKHPNTETRDEFLTAFFASSSPYTRNTLCNYISTQSKAERYKPVYLSQACSCFRISRAYEPTGNAEGWSQALSVFCSPSLPACQVQASLSRIESTLANVQVLAEPYINNEVHILKAVGENEQIGDVTNLTKLTPYLSYKAVQTVLPRLQEANYLLEDLLSFAQNKDIQGLLSSLIENYLEYLLENVSEQRLYLSLSTVAVRQQQWGALGALAEASGIPFIGKLAPRGMDVLSILTAVSPAMEEKELYAYGELLTATSSDWLDLLVSERRDSWLPRVLSIHKALGLSAEALALTRGVASMVERGLQVETMLETLGKLLVRPALVPAVCGLFEEVCKGAEVEILDWYFSLVQVSPVEHSGLVLALGQALHKVPNFRTFQPLTSALIASPCPEQTNTQLSSLPSPALAFPLLQDKLSRGESVEVALQTLATLAQRLGTRSDAEALFAAIVTDMSDAFIEKLGKVTAAQEMWACLEPLYSESLVLVLTAAINMPEQWAELQLLAQLSALHTQIQPAIQALCDNPKETAVFLGRLNELKRHPALVQQLLGLISPTCLKTLLLIADFAACLPDRCDLTDFLAFSAATAGTEVSAEDAELLLAFRDDPNSVLRALKSNSSLAALLSTLYPGTCFLCNLRVRTSKQGHLSCPCEFHTACLQAHFQGLAPSVDYFCPNPECKERVDRDLLADLLGAERYELCEKLKAGLLCPLCNARNPQEELEVSASAKLTCIACHAEFCGVCSIPWADPHSPEDCREEQLRAAVALIESVGMAWAQCPGCRRPAIEEDTNAVECRYCHTRWCFGCCALMLPILAHDNSWHRPSCGFHLPVGTKEDDEMKERCPQCQKRGSRCDPPKELRQPKRVDADEVQ